MSPEGAPVPGRGVSRLFNFKRAVVSSLSRGVSLK